MKGKKIIIFLSIMVCILVLGAIYFVTGNHAKKETIAVKVEQNVLDSFKNAEAGADPTRLLYASEKYVVLYDIPGLLVYDLEKEQVIQTLNLADINMNAMQGDDFASIEISEDGTVVYMEQLNKELRYQFDIANGTLTKLDKIDWQSLLLFKDNDHVFYSSDKGTPELDKLSALPLSEMVKINDDKWIYLSGDNASTTLAGLKIVVWTPEKAKEYELFK